jgi:type II secretory pathway component GspD/PulD (secretin)
VVVTKAAMAMVMIRVMVVDRSKAALHRLGIWMMKSHFNSILAGIIAGLFISKQVHLEEPTVLFR